MTSIDVRGEGVQCLVDLAPARTLLDVFAATVARSPHALAIEAGDVRLSYLELAGQVAAVAERLEAEGVGRGDRVGIRLPSGTAELYVGILGVLRAGAAYVPVDAEDPDSRAARIWESCGACAVIEAGLRITMLAPTGGAEGPPAPEDDAWIIFTSGSTGAPKGVAVSHRSATAFVDAEATLWTVTENDRVLAGLSVAFDASCEEMWLAWANGAALVPASRAVVRSGADLGPWLAAQRVSVVSTVPTLAALWDDEVLRDVRLLIVGGEACPDELGWRLASGRELWNTYGPTEATVVSTATRIRPGQPVTIGRPLPGWEVAVVDTDGVPVPFGQSGELVIAGVGLGRYLDADLDAAGYAPLEACGWARAYRSGDIVRETEDGLAFVGRRDHQVKLGGRRLELGEVEALLCAAPGVTAAAAVVHQTEAGNSVLVGYVTGDVDVDAVRTAVARGLSGGLAPLVIQLDALPLATSGKVDRRALPWPAPQTRAGGIELDATEAWLAERWAQQLGPLAFAPDADFFTCGGTSVAAAKLVSVVRGRYPAVAVADVYTHRTLGAFAARLRALGEQPAAAAGVRAAGARGFGTLRLFGVLLLLALTAGQWLIAILADDQLSGGSLPRVGWGWLIAGWLVLSSPASRSFIALGGQRLLLGRLEPGVYRRDSWLSCRVWFVERLTEACRVGRLAGTPWAGRYARLSGATVGEGASLATLPPPGALVRIGAGATVEAEVDMYGWWMEGRELIVGEVRIGARARVGTRAMLMPGADIGEGAEIEPGSVVNGVVPAGERWAGSPARRVGDAGVGWPEQAPTPCAHPRAIRALFAGGMLAESLIPVIAFVPVILAGGALGLPAPTPHTAAGTLLVEAVGLTAASLSVYALFVAGIARLTGLLIRPGWQSEESVTAWALWFNGNVTTSARAVLFPLMCSIYTRGWLRLSGVVIGRRTEISTAVGLNRLVSFGERSFATDDVVLSTARSRAGWLHVAPISVGDGSFLGNGALLSPGTVVGDGCLIGLLTTPPAECPDGTSWFGSPALELPRVAKPADVRRTTDPPRRLILARGTCDLIRILLPSTLAVLLGFGVLMSLQAIGTAAGILVMVLVAAPILLLAGAVAMALTVAIKWLVIGRYGCGEYPLWSWFVWRDELVNSAQEQLAGAWLLGTATGTPLMTAYLRAMGASVGRDVWCDTLALTEYDLVTLGEGCVVNRQACIETHLFHDRILSTGPAALGDGATLGPSSAVLPETRVGDRCSVGARSVVLRGEELPAETRWHGAPVVAR